MEPDPTQGAAQAATSVATPAAATPSTDPSTTSAAPAPAGGEPQTAPDPGRAVGEDFNHPVYGPKLRNFQKGLEEKAKRLKEIEEQHGTTKQQIADLNARLATKPELLNQVRALYGLPPLPTAQAQPTDDDPHTQTKAELERIEAQRAADQAIFEMQLELGQGNLTKGRELYTQMSTPAFEIMKTFDEGDARTRLAMAMEFHRLRSARANPPVPASTVPPTEMGRAAVGAPASNDGPMDWRKALALAGISEADWHREHGTFE